MKGRVLTSAGRVRVGELLKKSLGRRLKEGKKEFLSYFFLSTFFCQAGGSFSD